MDRLCCRSLSEIVSYFFTLRNLWHEPRREKTCFRSYDQVTLKSASKASETNQSLFKDHIYDKVRAMEIYWLSGSRDGSESTRQKMYRCFALTFCKLSSAFKG